jgi:hypothetical protein
MVRFQMLAECFNEIARRLLKLIREPDPSHRIEKNAPAMYRTILTAGYQRTRVLEIAGKSSDSLPFQGRSADTNEGLKAKKP